MLLRNLDIPYIDVCLDKHPKALEELSKFVSGNVVTPHIFFNEKHIASYSELLELTKSGEEFEKIIELVMTTKPPEEAPNLNIIQAVQDKDQTDENQNNDEVRRFPKEWIPTEYEKLVAMMRKANLIKDNRVSLTKTFRNSFKGEDFVSWVIRTKKIRRSEALELGQELIEQHFGQQSSADGTLSFDPEKYYQLMDDEDDGPLNCSRPPTNDITRDLGQFNELLKGLIEPIYDIILDADRQKVYIERLEDNVDFKHYITLMREAVNLNIENSTIEERLAFFTNCYNMQLIHINYKYGLAQTIWQRRRYLYSVYYQIGEHLYSLQSIFNGILRGNRIGHGMLWEPFGKEDKRRPFIIADGEPLVHFAINNYTVSTPPIKAYSAKTVIEDMKQTAQELIDTEAYLHVDCKKQTIQLSKMFKTYANDFGPNIDAVLEWIIDTMKAGAKRDSLIKLYYMGQYTITYLPMDYTPNFVREDS
uniref:DEP domain-containing protein n=1 Tax=Panagrolaimus sp. JU765 TaxID=591449 RepID=A0AC34RA63_9BILA